MTIIRAATNHDGRARLSTERGLEKQCQLGVMERDARERLPIPRTLLPLIKCLDAALERQQAFVDVVCLHDALAASVILPPRHTRHLLIAHIERARSPNGLIRLTLAYPFG